MSWILSETFAPPRIARNGLSGFSSAFAKKSSSFLTRKPAARWGSCTPTILECARCAVPNASFTYTSPSFVRPWRNSCTLAGSALVLLPSLSLEEPSSSMWKRRFSSRMTEPSEALEMACSTSGPTQSLTKMTFFESCDSSSAATGSRELRFMC
jgi:hypothetical protein